MSVQDLTAIHDADIEDQESSSDTTAEMGSSNIHVGNVVGFLDGRPLLTVMKRKSPIRAIAQTIQLAESDIGTSVAIVFDCGDYSRPVVIGKMAECVESGASNDRSRIEIIAEEELVLKCGKTTIKMSADGTISLRGANVISRATHTNRIRGGNVQIN